MKFIKYASENEMVSVFLKAELDSPRFGKQVSALAKKFDTPISVIMEPNLTSGPENKQRSKILSEYRGWENRTKMFERVTRDAKWGWFGINKQDVLGLHYVDYSYWNELSNGSHLVQDGVNKIKSGQEVFGVSNSQYFSLAKKIDEGFNVQPLILYDFGSGKSLEIIEGHVRATAIGLSGKKDIETQAIIGKNWSEL